MPCAIVAKFVIMDRLLFMLQVGTEENRLLLCSVALRTESRKMSNLPPAPTSLLIAFFIIQHLCEVSHVVSELSSS